MKKIVAAALCLIMLMSLFSCDIESSNDNKDNDITSNTDSNTLSEETDTTPIQKTQSEIAMEMYESVLKNEIKVYETDIQEYNYLADCKTPYNGTPLADCEQLKYAYTDMDNDSINELVIDCGDTLLLRYYEGAVYVYSFTFRSLYDLNTDGSYSWNHTGQDFEYGEKQIYFEGAELKAKELYRIVNDGEPNTVYYVEEKTATQEELQKYIEDNPKTRLVFLPLEVSLQKKITSEEALQIASEYWETEENKYLVEMGYNPNAPSSVYVVIIKWYVIDHYSTFDEIWIDKNTGEAIVPYWSDQPESQFPIETDNNEINNILSEAEKATEMYEAAIHDEINVIDQNLGEIKLSDCIFLNNNLRLGDCGFLKKAVLDMDGDGINEYVVQSETKDHIVLHYYNGMVYSFCFDGDSFHTLNTDGSFYWRRLSESEESSCVGLNRLSFDGSSLIVKVVYKIIIDPIEGFAKAYYLYGNQITSDEYTAYHNSNSKSFASFSPFDISCEYTISSEDAYEIVSNHWRMQDGDSEGACGTTLVSRIVILEKPNVDTMSYRICFQVEAYGHANHGWESQIPTITIYDELLVNAITGECVDINEVSADGK